MSLRISVIVPVYNASATLPACLKAIFNQIGSDTDVIVIDDCSTDSSAQIARNQGAHVFQMGERSGPAAARNLGAEKASGEILFFVDADVVVAAGSVDMVSRSFEESPQLSAVFGSYDDAPGEQNFLSQYRNLLHHFVHQESSSNAGTFWAGCGAIRKDVFHKVSGFDDHRYPHPSIEDIELGIRMVENKYSIRLDPKLQGKHLKHWSIRSLLKADILYRAYPWSRLIAVRGVLPKELNLKIYQRISGALTLLLIGLIVAFIFFRSWWTIGAAAFSLATLLLLNREVYVFFFRKKGALFLLGAVFWHTLYYLYSTITFAYCWIRFRLFAGKNDLPASRNAELHARHQP